MGLPVSTSLTAVADFAGHAAASYSVPPAHPWTVERMSATGSSLAQPILRVYRNGVMLDATGNANADTSESNGISLAVGDVLRAEWSGCTPGASMALIVEGSGD